MIYRQRPSARSTGQGPKGLRGVDFRADGEGAECKALSLHTGMGGGNNGKATGFFRRGSGGNKACCRSISSESDCSRRASWASCAGRTVADLTRLGGFGGFSARTIEGSARTIELGPKTLARGGSVDLSLVARSLAALNAPKTGSVGHFCLRSRSASRPWGVSRTEPNTTSTSHWRTLWVPLGGGGWQRSPVGKT